MKHRRAVDLLAGAPRAAPVHAAAAEAADGAPGDLPEDPPVAPPVAIWADGACKGNPGPGGWGAVLRIGASEQEIFGGVGQTTNNRMELTAVIEALARLEGRRRVVVHTDSQYVQLGMTEWLASWIRRGWRTAANAPVKNADLWRRLAELAAQHEVQWRWVRGHAGDPGNERADALANRGVDAAAAER